MNFDEALRHMQEGTATEEEKAFVEAQLKQAHKSVNTDKPRIIEKPKPPKIKGQKRERSKFFTLVAVIVVVFLALGVIFAGVFGGAAAHANKAEAIERADAEKIAREFVFTLTQDGKFNLPLVTSLDDVKIYDVDHDLHYVVEKPMSSFNVYEIILTVMNSRVEVEVDTRTGQCKVTDLTI